MTYEGLNVEEVVWIHKADLVQFDEYNDHVFDADLYLKPCDEHTLSYTLTTTAEANTRKAVEDALAELVDYLDRCSNKLDRAGAELYSVLDIIKHARELILNGYKYEPLKAIE